jgi:tetratricopeptide (TPR) repeat protein
MNSEDQLTGIIKRNFRQAFAVLRARLTPTESSKFGWEGPLVLKLLICFAYVAVGMFTALPAFAQSPSGSGSVAENGIALETRICVVGVVLPCPVFKNPSPAMVACSQGEWWVDLNACDQVLADGTSSDIERAVAYIKRGFMLKSSYDYAMAIRAYPKYLPVFELRCFAIELQPGWKEDACSAAIISGLETSEHLSFLYAWRSNARYQQWQHPGSANDALRDLAEAARLNPNQPAIYVFRAFTHSSKKEYAEAIEDYTEALKVSPNNLSLLSHQAGACVSAGDLDCAISKYSEVIARWGKQAAVQPCSSGTNLSTETNPGLDLDSNEVQKELASSLIHFSCDTKADGSVPVEAYSNRGMIYAEKGQCDSAIPDLTLVINSDWTWPPSNERIMRAKCYLTIGRYSDAVSDLDMVKDREDVPSFFELRSTALWRQGRYGAAIRDYVKAVYLRWPFASKS